MGKSSPKSPAAPDPVATSAAQTATNKETAYWNAVLNNVNQITPYGNMTFTQSGGGKKYNDEGYNTAMQNYNTQLQGYNTALNSYSANNNGKNDGFNLSAPTAPKHEDYFISEAPPQFTSKIELSPEQQKLLDTQNRSDNALATLGEQQIGRIGQAVNSPYSFDGLPKSFSDDDFTQAQSRAEEALYSRLDPKFSQDEEALRSRLINQGITQGSEAYNREMNTFNQAKNDARQQAILGGQQYGTALMNNSLTNRNQAINEYNTQRNAPLNEYTALTSGQQIQNPQFQSQNYQGAQSTDTAGIANQAYQNAMGQYNSKVAQNNQNMQTTGNFLGTAATLFGLSDERLKENIIHIGAENQHNVYEFSYKGDDKRYIGVMAQEVEKIDPEAVIYNEDGYRMVNYSKIGVQFREVQ